MATQTHRQAVKKALVRLAPLVLSREEMLAVTLHYADGMSTAEVAATLEVTESTAVTLLNRAKTKMRRSLREEGLA